MKSTLSHQQTILPPLPRSLRWFMPRWLLHPVTVFVALQILWVAVVVMWVVWYFGRQEQLAELSRALGAPQIEHGSTIAILVVGIVLLVLLLAGTVMLFIWGQRQASFLLQQKTFVSSVTHELRSPIASIHLGFETLRLRQLDDENRNRLLDMCLIDLERLMRVVDQVLVSARLDRGLNFFLDDIDTFNVMQKLRDVVKGLQYLAADVGVRVKLAGDENLAWAFSRGAFSLVMVNLISNALKYSPADSPIDVSFSGEGTTLRIDVRDHGFGLDKREKKKIFKMFHRGTLANQKAIPGTGLGLFIVKTIVEQFNGSIRAESQGRGLGSHFIVTLPRVKSK